MATDEELESSFNSYKGKKEKYERVRNSIISHQLDYTRSTKEMDDFIIYCKGIVSTVNNEPGYHYLSNFSTKLQADIDTMTSYRDFVQDANTSFKNLCVKLESEIETLNAKMDTIRDEYNKDKFWPWDKL